MAPVRIGHSLEDQLGSVVALVKKEFSCGSYVFFRQSVEGVIQNTATPLCIEFVCLENIHNRIPRPAEGPIVALGSVVRLKHSY
jgi:hypothetical protein